MVEVRTAKVEDGEEIRRLWLQSGLDILPGPGNIVVLIAEKDSKIVGFAAFAVDGKRAVGIGVASTHPGAGTTLMEHGFMLARDLGATWVIGAARQRVVHWHERLGYQNVGMAEKYFADGEPAWFMVKDL